MTYEELLQLTNIEVFITSDYKAFVFTVETYDEELDDTNIKYYKVTKRENGCPTIEKLNNTIELILSNKIISPNTPYSLQPQLIKLDKNKDQTVISEFIQLITRIEKGGLNHKKSTPNFPTTHPTEMKLLKAK